MFLKAWIKFLAGIFWPLENLNYLLYIKGILCCYGAVFFTVGPPLCLYHVNKGNEEDNYQTWI